MLKAPKRNGLIAAGAVAIAAALVIQALYAAPATQPAADPLPPRSTAPAPSPKANVVPVPYRPVMPPAVVSHDPKMVPADKSHALTARPAIDLPPLATSTSALPAAAALPAGPGVHVDSADVAQVPIGTIAEKPDTARPTLRTDPTADFGQRGATVVKAPPRTIPPPAQLLSIPDPAHQAGYIPTPSPAVEDAPVTNIDRPGPTTLPIATK